MKKLLLPLCLISFVISCGPSAENKSDTNDTESSQIDNDYLLGSIELKDNSKSIADIKQEIKLIKSNGGFSNLKSKLGEDMNLVKTGEVISKIFDSETCPCQLPKSVKKKLKGEFWMPKEVKTYLTESFPEKAIHLKAESALSLLHKITIKSSNGKETVRVVNPSSIENFDISKFLLKDIKDNFVYTLDCSGYLNASISAAGGVVNGNIKTETEMALINQKSLFIAGGTFVSPISAAYYGQVFGAGNLSKEERISVLKALILIPDLNDSDSIIVPSSYQIIWSSNKGDGGFNGKSQLNSTGDASVGVAKVAVKENAATEITKKSSFSSYHTLFTEIDYFGKFKPFTVKQVKLRIAELSK